MNVINHDIHLPCFDLGQIQDVVDKGQEIGARGVDCHGGFNVVFIQPAVPVLCQKPGQKDDGI